MSVCVARPVVHRFEQFEVRPAERTVVAAGKPVAVGGRAVDLLLVLIENAGSGRVVGKV